MLCLIPCRRFKISFTPCRVLLIVNTIFILLTVPFLLFCVGRRVFTPVATLIDAVSEVNHNRLSIHSDISCHGTRFARIGRAFGQVVSRVARLGVSNCRGRLRTHHGRVATLGLRVQPRFILGYLGDICTVIRANDHRSTRRLVLLLDQCLHCVLSFATAAAPLRARVRRYYGCTRLSDIKRGSPIRMMYRVSPRLDRLPLPPISLLALIRGDIGRNGVVNGALGVAVATGLLRARRNYVTSLSITSGNANFATKSLGRLGYTTPRRRGKRRIKLFGIMQQLRLLCKRRTTVTFAGGHQNNNTEIRLFLPVSPILRGGRKRAM